MKNVGQRALVQKIRNSVLAGVERAEKTLRAYGQIALPLSAAATTFTLRELERLRAAASGEPRLSGIADHLLALHGPLLWLPRLHFGRSWLPSPYQPEIIVNAILGAQIPLWRQSGDNFSNLEQVVRARLGEDSFVAARLLAEGGAFFGVTDAERGQLRDLIEANVQTRRDALSGDIAEVRRIVDRVQRMGMLRGVDDAQFLLSLLDRIDVDKLPADAADRSASDWGRLASHFPNVECGGSGGSLLMRHLLSRMRSRIALARKSGSRRSNFGPSCLRRTSLAAQAIDHSGVSGSGRSLSSAMPHHENKTRTFQLTVGLQLQCVCFGGMNRSSSNNLHPRSPERALVISSPVLGEGLHRERVRLYDAAAVDYDWNHARSRLFRPPSGICSLRVLAARPLRRLG